MAWQSLGIIRGKKKFNLRMWQRTGYEYPEYAVTQDCENCTVQPTIGGHWSRKDALASFLADAALTELGKYSSQY